MAEGKDPIREENRSTDAPSAQESVRVDAPQARDAGPAREGEDAQVRVSAADRLRASSGKRPEETPAAPRKSHLLRNILMMLGAVVVVAGIAVIVAFVLPEPAKEDADSTPVLEALIEKTTDQFDRVKVTNETGVYTLKAKGEDEYEILERPEITVANSGGRDLRSVVTTLRPEAVVEENPTDLAQYGLDSPRATAEVTYTDGTTAKLLLGADLISGQGSYLMKDGDPAVYTVWMNVANAMTCPVGKLRYVALPEFEALKLRNIKIERTGQEPIEFVYQEDKRTMTPWKFVSPPVEADDQKLSELAEKIIGLSLGEFQAEATSLAEYGLDAPRARLTVKDVDGQTLNLSVGAPKSDYYDYVRVDETNFVYVMSSSALSFLDDVTTLGYVYQFTNIINIADVDRVDIGFAGGSTALTIQREPAYDEKGERKKNAGGDPIFDETFFQDGKEVKEKAFKYYYRLVIGTLIDGVMKKEVTDQTPVLTVKYTFNDGQQPMVMEYFPYDLDNYAVSRDGEMYFTIHKEKIQAILDGVEQLRNGELDEMS